MNELSRELFPHVPRGWEWSTLEELPGVEVVGYGVNRPGRHEDSGIPMLRAGDIEGGRVRAAAQVLISRAVEEAHARTRLRCGDVVVVLVGRVGEAAVIKAHQAAWNVARSVAVVRCSDPGLAEWLRVWLAMPPARAWCAENASGTVQQTLSLAALRRMPVPLPPVERRDLILYAVRTIEDKLDVNERIAKDAVALAGAHFAAMAKERQLWDKRSFNDVAQARTGVAAKPASLTVEGAGTAWLAPADVLQNPLPYLDRTEKALGGDPGHVCAPGSVLVVAKAGEVQAAINQVPVVAGRGVLALRPAETVDRWWLLHEIRSRSAELSSLAQGTQARELSARAFLPAPVCWPPAELRHRFASLAEALYDRALEASRQNCTLKELSAELLRRAAPE
ncbi:hypothetical protein [Streptomyces sp. NPDC046261]|uniref:hypothetical protein n=1 Tax=Streptomyces sp. NPDC046261 TaxID=3157200 RepID=UPI0033D06B67